MEKLGKDGAGRDVSEKGGRGRRKKTEKCAEVGERDRRINKGLKVIQRKQK